jgi:hypothetical protein
LFRELGGRRGELTVALDLGRLAGAASGAQPAEFGAIADLLRELGGRRGELTVALDLGRLAATASGGRPAEFGAIADLLRELGGRRGELTAALDLRGLAATASSGRPAEFGAIAELGGVLDQLGCGFGPYIDLAGLVEHILTAASINPHTLRGLMAILGPRGGELLKLLSCHPELFGRLLRPANSARLGEFAAIIRKLDDQMIMALDFQHLAELGAGCAPKDIPGLTLLVRALGGHRGWLEPQLPWPDLLRTCPIDSHHLPAVAECIRCAVTRARVLDRPSELRFVDDWSWRNRDRMRDATSGLYLMALRQPARSDTAYGYFSQLLSALRDGSPRTGDYIVRRTIRSFRRSISARSVATPRLCALLDLVGDISPEVATRLRREPDVAAVLAAGAQSD